MGRGVGLVLWGVRYMLLGTNGWRKGALADRDSAERLLQPLRQTFEREMRA